MPLPSDKLSFIRTIGARLREFIGDRRRSVRYNVNLTFSTSLHDIETGAEDASRALTLVGHTKNVSANGLGLIVPSMRFGDRYFLGKGRTLSITLQLPDGPIKLRAAPVRYEQLDEEEAGMGYLLTGPVDIHTLPTGAEGTEQDKTMIRCLIGLRITDMSAKDRESYDEFLETLAVIEKRERKFKRAAGQ